MAFRVTLQKGYDLMLWSSFPLTSATPRAPSNPPISPCVNHFSHCCRNCQTRSNVKGNWPVLVYGLEGMLHHEGEGMVCELLTSGQMRNQKGLFTLCGTMAHNEMASVTFRVSPPSSSNLSGIAPTDSQVAREE